MYKHVSDTWVKYAATNSLLTKHKKWLTKGKQNTGL